MDVAVKQVESVFVQWQEYAHTEKFGVLGLGNIDRVALELAGKAPDFGRVEGFAELGAEGEAFFTEWDEDRFGVVVDQLEVAGGGFELEV